MKRLTCLVVVLLLVLLLQSLFLSCAPASPMPVPGPAPAPVPSKSAVPEVPIKYPGDTDKTIIRRADWIGKANKEGALTWWSIGTPAERQKIVDERRKAHPKIRYICCLQAIHTAYQK